MKPIIVELSPSYAKDQGFNQLAANIKCFFEQNSPCLSLYCSPEFPLLYKRLQLFSVFEGKTLLKFYNIEKGPVGNLKNLVNWLSKPSSYQLFFVDNSGNRLGLAETYKAISDNLFSYAANSLNNEVNDINNRIINILVVKGDLIIQKLSEYVYIASTRGGRELCCFNVDKEGKLSRVEYFTVVKTL